MQQPFFQERLQKRVFIRLLIRLNQTAEFLKADTVGEEHYNVAKEEFRSIYRNIKNFQDIIAILGMEELSEEDKTTVFGMQEKLRNSFLSPSM